MSTVHLTSLLPSGPVGGPEHDPGGPVGHEPEVPVSVVAALAAVRRDLPGLPKDATAAPGMGGYAYRSIEAITAVLGPLLGRHGVVPTIEAEEVVSVVERTIKGAPWTDTTLAIRYRIYGPRGDSISVGPIHGMGRDNSDKGLNKARTQAQKYLWITLLTIGDGRADADSGSPGTEPAPGLPDAEVLALRRRIDGLDDDDRAALRSWCRDHELAPRVSDWTPAQRHDVEEWLDERQHVWAQPEGGEPF